MKFTIQNRRLRDAFSSAAMAAVGRSTRPILEHVLVTARTDGTLKMQSQTEDQFVEVVLRGVEVSKAGEALAHKSRFSSVLGAIDSKQTLEIERIKRGHGLQVVYGHNELFTIPTEDEPQDFGQMVELGKLQHDVTLDLAAAASLTQAVVGAVAGVADAGRFCNDHVLFAISPNSKLRSIATNAKRLVVSESTHEEELKEKIELFLPKSAVRFLHRLWNDTPRKVKVEVCNDVAMFTIDEADTRYRQKVSLGRGAFPPYEKFLEEREWMHEIRINREKLVAAVHRVMAVQLSGDYEQIAFLFKAVEDKTEIRIAGMGEDHSLGATKVVVDSPWKGDPFEIAFSPRFIVASLNDIPDATVWWRFSDNSGQSLIEGTRTRVVVMPIHPDVLTVLNDAMDYAREAKLEKTNA